MASCAITIGGTSGSVVINYLLGAVAHTMTGSFGETIYINDTATAITYTNVSGDATASSVCVTITNLPTTCYIFDWSINTVVVGCDGFSYVPASDYTFDAVLLDSTVVPLTSTSYSEVSSTVLAQAINDLNDSRVEAVATKVTSGTGTREMYLIVKVTGTYVPQIRVNATIGNHKLYLKGTVTVDCIPNGYTAFTNCPAL